MHTHTYCRSDIRAIRARTWRPLVRETGKDFAMRLMHEKYGKDKWNPDNAEFKKIQKWGDRNFRIPLGLLSDPGAI